MPAAFVSFVLPLCVGLDESGEALPLLDDSTALLAESTALGAELTAPGAELTAPFEDSTALPPDGELAPLSPSVPCAKA
jgi:hypothetical protein